MDFFTRLFTMSIIPIGVSLIMWLGMRESEKEEKSNYEKQTVVVRFAKIVIWVTLAAILMCIILLVGMITSPTKYVLPLCIIDGCFLFLSVWFFYYLLIWKVEVIKGENFFLLRDGFGRRSKIFYADCIRIEEREQGYIVHTKTKKVEMAHFYIVNSEFLIAELQKHHVKLEKNLKKKKKA